MHIYTYIHTYIHIYCTHAICVMYVCIYMDYVKVSGQLGGACSVLPLWVLKITLTSSVQQMLSHPEQPH